MCYNTNEYGCSLFDTLFLVNRNMRVGCGCQGCWNSCNRCGWTTNTINTTNTCGCNTCYGQVFSLPVSGRVFFRIGGNTRNGCGYTNNTANTCGDAYYAAQYGLTGGRNVNCCHYNG